MGFHPDNPQIAPLGTLLRKVRKDAKRIAVLLSGFGGRPFS